MTRPFEAHFSPARSILLSLLAVGFVAAGLWMVGAFGEVPGGSRRLPDWAVPIMGWVAIVFFAPFAFLHLRRAFAGGLAVRIDQRGMLLTDYSKRLIAWEDIVAIRTENVMGNKILLFEVDDARAADFGAGKRMAAGTNRSMYGLGYSLTVNNTDRSHSELLQALEHFAPHRLLG